VGGRRAGNLDIITQRLGRALNGEAIHEGHEEELFADSAEGGSRYARSTERATLAQGDALPTGVVVGRDRAAGGGNRRHHMRTALLLR
jgi:hypothetical protein